MSCHTGPMGGFGRKPMSRDDIGYITDKFYMSGDFIFMALYDRREGPDTDNRVVLFPMQGALHFAFLPTPKFTITASQDFGDLREVYAMLHNEAQTAYVRAGYFTLPYGLQFPDHTSFIKEGRVEAGRSGFNDVGTGAGLFSVRYADSGVEAGFSGRPWFLNFAVTGGAVDQDVRSGPQAQTGTKKALTRRAGFITKNVSLGVSNYTNDNENIDRRILRYGVFGWLRAGPIAFLFEHDEGEEEQFTVSGSTQMAASYAELVYAYRTAEKKWPVYVKLRYERLDQNRSLDDDTLQRVVGGFRFSPAPFVAIESLYRKNFEEPVEIDNDDMMVMTHVFF